MFSVFDQFFCFQDEVIDKYAKNAQGKSFLTDEDKDPYLSAAIDDVWNKTKNIESIKLSNILRKPDSAWDHAFQNEESTLSPELIKLDTSYIFPLGFKNTP